MFSYLINQNIAEIQISYSSKVKAADRPVITKSNQAHDIFKACFPSLEHREYFYVLFLNRANRVIGIYQASVGGITGTVVDPKIVYQAALKANATSIICAHNHPSGQIHPSDADVSLTRKLKNAGEFLELPMLDHLIIAEDRYYSFSDEGKI